MRTPRIPANYLMRTGLLRRSFEAPETNTALHKYHSNEHPLFAPVLRCRQSTMPPHRLFPPPCPDTNIEYSLLQYLCKAVPVVIRECPHDSLGLLSPLRCFAKLRSYPHTPDLSQKIIPQWFPAVSLRRFFSSITFHF